jgi:hypothetical protein
MLIRVLEGTYDPDGGIDRNDAVEPKGREIWTAGVEDLTAAALHAAGTQVDPGTWYGLEQFKRLVSAAKSADEANVFSTVSTRQSGVGRSWTAVIEVAQSTAVLMVCHSVIEHLDQLKKASDVWIRVE